MKRTLCYRCEEYHKIADIDNVIAAYSKPVKVVMVPVYVSKKIEGSQNKRKWERVGFLGPRCKDFLYHEGFKPKRHA